VASSASSVRSARPDLVGSETPRIFTPPLRTLTPKTSLGFACIEFADEVLGIDLMPWQRWYLIHALELLPDGRFRFRKIILLVARQNGKSTLLQVMALFFMYVWGVKLVIGTAQNLDIAEEVWQGAVDIAEDIPELAAEIKNVNKTNGKKALELQQGERYKVQAANRRGGRGLSGDLVMLDELREHQSWDAWAAITKTTNARPKALILAASNAGDAASIVLRHLRLMAHVALGDPDGLQERTGLDDEDLPDEVDLEDETLGIFEWSAHPDADPGDPASWPQPNPALGYTIEERVLRSDFKTDPEWVFRTEVLCQWSDGTLEGPFPTGTWASTTDPSSSIPEGEPFVFCVDVSWDRSTSHIAVAGRREDGLKHVEVVASRAGTDWVVPWLEERKDTDGLRGVTLQSKGSPVSTLLDDIEATGIPVINWSGSDVAPACGAFYDAVRVVDEQPDMGLRHLPQPVLDVAAATAATRPLGDAWAWDRKKSPHDIAPLVACTGAAWALDAAPEPGVSIYETRGMEVVG
jgi:hypothetical protein